MIRKPSTSPAIVLGAGFDREALLVEMRRLFVTLQDAWDHGDVSALKRMTTPELLEELCIGREGGSTDLTASITEVVTLQTELLAFEALEHDDVLSVQFSGLMRESTGNPAMPFREVWLLTRSRRTVSDWRLARHQALL